MADAILKPVPQTLYPTKASLSDAVVFLNSQLPITSPNELKAALMTYHNTLLHTRNQGTVASLAESRYPGRTFDTALPQGWVNNMTNRGFDPRGHFVTLYPTGSMLGFYMAPITDEGVEMAARVASMEA